MARSSEDSGDTSPDREKRRPNKPIDRARINEIVALLAALQVVDGRCADALIGYDARGLPI